MKLKSSLVLFILFTAVCAKAQVEGFNYKRTISKPTDVWHRINLPSAVFNKLNDDLSDIRIYGTVNQQDTIEVPYILQRYDEKIVSKNVEFALLNQSKNEIGSYFTFEVPVEDILNQIVLNFANQNFDWRATLQGSHDLKEWFTITDDYRILSIKNLTTDFVFSTINFPASKYQYFRVVVSGDVEPSLQSASLVYNEKEPGRIVEYTSKFSVSNNRERHKTTIEIDLKGRVPVNQIRLKVASDFDYYRPYIIQYLSDSFKTERGWQYNYSELGSGTINSLEDEPIHFKNSLAKEFRIIIENHDNQPLIIDSVFVYGDEHALIARFTEDGDYFLVYGNRNAHLPQYDIYRFTEKIPTDLKVLEVGKEEDVLKFVGSFDMGESLFSNPVWLWIILLVVASALGWFSFKMLKKAN